MAIAYTKGTYAENFGGLCVGILLIASLSLILKNFGFKGAPVFVALSFCVVISSMADELSGILSLFSDFSTSSEIAQYTEGCLKVIGIGYLAGISADVCREIGELGAARCITVLSKFELIAICIPFMKELFESTLELLGG